MTFIQFAGWQPGMIITEERANSAALTGRVVFSAIKTTPQSIPTSATLSAANALTWDSIRVDLLGGWSATQPSRWTCSMAGWYELEGAVTFSTSTAGGSIRNAAWYINGALANGGNLRIGPPPATTVSGCPARSLPILLAVGDYIQLVPAQDTGAALDTATGSYMPTMTVRYAGPA